MRKPNKRSKIIPFWAKFKNTQKPSQLEEKVYNYFSSFWDHYHKSLPTLYQQLHQLNPEAPRTVKIYKNSLFFNIPLRESFVHYVEYQNPNPDILHQERIIYDQTPNILIPLR